MMMRLILPLLLLSSCTMRTFDCGVVDVEGTRKVVLDEYPDVADTFDRMDVYCVDDVSTFQTCQSDNVEACTAWIGNGPYRGRVYMDLGEDFDAVLLHEAQHWHLMELNNDDGCPSHEAACGWKD